MAIIKEILGIDMVTPVYKSKLVEGDSEQLAGVEIETEEVRATAGDYQSMLGRLWNVKTDGSLRGAAFEFVSRPCAIKSLIPELEVFYKKTQFTEANYSDRCSVHVHTNVLDMTPDQLASLCLLYSVMEEVLFKFVNTYEVGNRVPSRDTNLYCVPWSQCRMNYGVVNRLFTLDGLGLRNWQKYTALNLVPVRNIGTVEWRHMHGTANTKKLSIWINMIDSLLTYAKKTELGGLIEIIKDLNNHSLYQQFYEATLGNALPYQEDYADALYQGVINAKYSLIGYSDRKEVTAEKVTIKTVSTRFNEANLFQHHPQEDVPLREAAGAFAEGRPAVRFNRLNTEQGINWVIAPNPFAQEAQPEPPANPVEDAQAASRLQVAIAQLRRTYA